MTGELAQLQALADPARAAEMAAHHKGARPFLGIPGPQIDALVADWRAALSVADRIALAGALWDTGIHEAMLAAAKLLTQARLRPDAEAWRLIRHWAAGFDGWALADPATIAGQKRLVADPSRIADVAYWVQSPNIWTRRAALVVTLPYAKMHLPKPADLAIRETALDWAADFATDRDAILQKAVAGWLRDLSKHDAPRVRAFLDGPGAALQPFARRDASRHL